MKIIICSPTMVTGRQTVPRAELYAASLAAESLATNSEKCGTTYTDAAYVVSCIKVDRAEGERKNDDLRTRLRNARQVADQQVEKVKAHAQVDLLQGRVDPEIYLGNLLADAGAGAVRSATTCCLARSERALEHT